MTQPNIDIHFRVDQKVLLPHWNEVPRYRDMHVSRLQELRFKKTSAFAVGVGDIVGLHLQVPKGEIWQPHRIMFQCTTSANSTLNKEIKCVQGEHILEMDDWSWSKYEDDWDLVEDASAAGTNHAVTWDSDPSNKSIWWPHWPEGWKIFPMVTSSAAVNFTNMSWQILLWRIPLADEYLSWLREVRKMTEADAIKHMASAALASRFNCENDYT